ncbi:hypothetical protein NUW54_g5015 [Trametes sanguinea]|uniref:Uncharacterized protein n=1 Tax=Trametes sanguinea TaxID=158606 RepID=A0ACC1PWF5_9APHY|nr:hypothetical protein NUW54_g5015 [Trametes sanguinea]
MKEADYTAIAQAVYAFAETDDPLAKPVAEALQVIDDAFDSWGEEHISLSFNGGKDCTVLLHLVAASLGRRTQAPIPPKPLAAVYIPVPSPFPQLEAFIDEVAKAYHLDLFHCPHPSGPNFSIAAAFGNVHGVYKPGNVRLHPELLNKHQVYAEQKLNGKKKPLFLVFHGGSGSTKEEIKTAVQNGVVKMNVDTDTQWAYLCGIRDFIQNKSGYLQTQVGNPEGADKPNKKYYDPRVWVREGEKTLVQRVKEACADLGNTGMRPSPTALPPMVRSRTASRPLVNSEGCAYEWCSEA